MWTFLQHYKAIQNNQEFSLESSLGVHAITDKEKQEETELEEVYWRSNKRRFLEVGTDAAELTVDLQHNNNRAELSAMQSNYSHPSQHSTAVRVSPKKQNTYFFKNMWHVL